MSQQLIDRKERGRLIAKMDGSLNRISGTSFTVSSQPGSWKLGVMMRRGPKIHERKISNITTAVCNRFHGGMMISDV